MRFSLQLLTLVFSFPLAAQTVTNIAGQYHDGQIFITWNNIPGADTGFYYVYKNSVPITASNIQSSTYLGRVPYNFSYDYRFTYSTIDHNIRYLVINDNPRKVVTKNQNVFVMTCAQNNAFTYFAVRCDFGKTTPNWSVFPGANSIEEGFAVKQHLDPVKAYLQEPNVAYPGSSNGETLDVYIHYGSNIAVSNYPGMANEGCLPFHFGIIKTGPVGGSNLCLVKFHGGNGNFISNAINSVIANSWKISFDDWIPNFQLGESGFNTKWFGYHEKFDVYKAGTESIPPISGTVRSYTYRRVKWELGWIEKNWAYTIDTNRVYLVGASQGCAGVWIHSMLDFSKYAAGNATDGKLNMDAPDDDNPECKYNDTSTARIITRILWGNEDSTNLATDIPKVGDATKFYKIYDLTNISDMLVTLKNYSLPFLSEINGKNDATTCWEEKIGVYSAVNVNNSGGCFYWDLRGHGGGDTEWPPLAVPDLSRYRSNLSYPAFSNCSLNGNPGDTNNPSPPYYDGDDIGSINGNAGWVDSTLADSVASWQVRVFEFQVMLNNGSLFPAVLPGNAKADVTIRRAQLFKNIPKNTKLCWSNNHNGSIQSGTFKVTYSGTIQKPITIKGVKIYADGSLLRIEICDQQRQGNSLANHPVIPESEIQIYPNPFEDHFNISLQINEPSLINIKCCNLLGENVSPFINEWMNEGKQIIPMHTEKLPPGVYFIRVNVNGNEQITKVMKF